MISFILNDSIVRTEAKTGMTLLHFIREDQHLKGTKSGCKEGDCGACTVLSGSSNSDGSISYQNITSCLTPLANVQGKHIVTIEGLNIENDLNVAQHAIKEHNATQCGFCTPGFVVSMSGLALQQESIQQESGIAAISGNICRCTGYKSIESAAHEVFNQLLKSGHHNNLNWLMENNFIPSYFKDIPDKLKHLNPIVKKSNGTLVAGGTDIYVQNADELFDENVSALAFEESSKIEFSNSMCTLGAGVTVSNLLKDKNFKNFFPQLKSHFKLVSSEPIRNIATIGGNFVNASPIGDMSIFFLALDSILIISNDKGEKRDVFLRDFFKDYKLIDLKENEFIQRLLFNLPEVGSFFNFEKVSKRTHLDIASVNTAISLKVNNNRVSDAHISIGGVSAIPLYLTKTSDFINGKELTHQLIKNTQEIMQKEISPISDVRGSTAYKRLLARQLFYAHFIRLFPEIIQLKSLLP